MPVINSLLDNDLYKYSMMQCVLHNFPTARAEYKFILRSKGIDLRPYRKAIEEEIQHLCSISLKEDELFFLRGHPFFSPDYIDFLENFRLNANTITLYEEDNQLGIRIKGSWVQTILLEVPILSIVSEVYLRDKSNKEECFKIGYEKLEEKNKTIASWYDWISFADFGTRRRYSREWQDRVIEFLMSKANFKKSLVGTSNLFLAKKYMLTPIGTMAHEYLMAGQGLGLVQLVNSQKFMLEKWVQEYRGDLGIALSDTINMKSFLNDFDLYFSKLFDGCRHDSGDPFEWGESLVSHYKKMGIDPMTKTAVFSDGLNFEKIVEITKHFRKRINTSFGIGTNLTNDVGIQPLSMVIKLVRINGNPVAKISDEPSKAICVDPDFLKYLKKVYNVK